MKKKYKITCIDPNWVGSSYDGLEFKAVAYTDDYAKAVKYMHDGFHKGGIPLFTVEEVQETE